MLIEYELKVIVLVDNDITEKELSRQIKKELHGYFPAVKVLNSSTKTKPKKQKN